MKLISVMIMALLLVAGIGSAQNYLPETVMEPGADLSMFSGDPGNVEMASGNVNNATYINSSNGIFGGYRWGDAVLSTAMGTPGSSSEGYRYGLTSYLHSHAELGLGNVLSAVYARELLASDFIGHGWGSTVWLSDYSTNSSGQHVGFYSRVEGARSGSPLWSFCGETYDFFPDDPGNSSAKTLVGIELQNHKIDAGASVGAHIIASGNSTHTDAIRISGRKDYPLEGNAAYWYNGIDFEAGSMASNGIGIAMKTPMAVGIDLSGGSYSSAGIRVPSNTKVSLETTSANFIRYNNTSPSAVEVGTSNVFRILKSGTKIGEISNKGIWISSSPPATPNSAGTMGTITYDANYVYVCYEPNKWGRIALTKSW